MHLLVTIYDSEHKVYCQSINLCAHYLAKKLIYEHIKELLHSLP